MRYPLGVQSLTETLHLIKLGCFLCFKNGVRCAYRTYFAAISLFRNRLLSIATKIRVYKILIRPVVTDGAETWTMTKKEEQAVSIFERKIFRRIFGPKYEDGEWKSRTNRVLEELSKGESIVK